MKQLMDILQAALEALANHNVSQPTEIEMFQGMHTWEWWVHTDVGYYVSAYPLRGFPGLWTTVHAYIPVEVQHMNPRELLARWLELDKTVDHDGDAEVTEAEREQWKIEYRLDELGFYLGWNPSSQQIELIPVKVFFQSLTQK